jgi:hypothetical protein
VGRMGEGADSLGTGLTGLATPALDRS